MVNQMAARNLQRATFDGEDWWGERVLTDISVRRDGRWQLVPRHASNLAAGTA